MKESTGKMPDGVDELRSRMDADARFHRVISGYDPGEVCAYVEEVRRVFFKQAKLAKQEQESLLSQLESAKSETQARNCAIKSLKETLAHRESLLSESNARVTTLVQSVKQLESERAGMEELKTANERMRAAEASAINLEQETQRYKTMMVKAANLIEKWKDDRTNLAEENARLKQETEYLRGLIQTVLQQKIDTPQNPAANQAAAHPGELRESAKAVTLQLPDTFTDAFVEAYDLVKKFRSIEEPRKSVTLRPAQPRMQVLRPDGTASDCLINEP